MRYLGIDFGLKKIGLALGDSETKIASPIETIPNNDFVFSTFDNLIKGEGVEELVVGVPMSAGDFHNSEQLELTRKFINNLQSASGLVVHEVDESYTSKEGQRLQKECGAQASEDSLAAMLILQAFLDSME